MPTRPKCEKLIRKSIIFNLVLLFTTLIGYTQAPTANFTAVNTAGCSPLVVDFQDQSGGNPTSWFWDFGNGATSTLKNPSTTFFKEGIYSVKLTVTNAAGSNTLTRSNLITIYGKPTPAFSTSDSSGCFPVRAQLSDQSTASAGTVNTTWFWDFGDGTQSTEQSPLHVYTTSGNFAVTVKVTNDKGCYSVLTKPSYIQVTDGVISKFTNTTAAVCKPPFSITFNNNSTGSGTLSYYWDFGDGSTSTLQNPTHSYTTTGNYTVSLATTSTIGCTDTLSKVGLINTTDISNSFNAPDSICIGLPALFENTSTPTPVSTVWNFGDGTTSTDSMPAKVFNSPGTYKVILYNKYSYCTDSVSRTILVAPDPVTNFNVDNSFSCKPPFTVNFQDASSNGVSWQWDFGDSTTSSLQNPSHMYNDFGYYTVRLIITNASGCSDTLTKDSLVKIVKPVITIPSLPARGCIPYRIDPVATITTLDNVTSYLWDFGDGTTSTAANPSHTYTVQGTYTVTLTITTSTGCTEILTIPEAVKVGTIPVVNFNAIPTTVCAYQPVFFTNQTDISDEWVWNFGDGNGSTAENPSHEFTETGTFDVTLTATNNGCSRSLTKTNLVTVKPPIAKFNVTANCSNRLQYNFIDQSTGATTWFWDFGDGTTSTATSPTHNFPNFGTYNVTLTVTNDTCSHSITKAVRIFDENPDFTSTATVACRRTTIHFGAQVDNPSNFINYYWTFGDGAVWDSDNFGSTGASYHYYSAAGTYDVSLTTTDIYGCKTVVQKPQYIRINGPDANFNASNTSGCAGLTTTFNDLTKGDGVHALVNWKWEYGDGTIENITAPPFQHVYSDTGTYSVNLVVTDASGCRDSVNKINIITTSKVIADFKVDTATCPGKNITFINSSDAQNFTSIWNFGDNNTSVINSPTHSYTDTGRYTIQLIITDGIGCIDSVTKVNHVRVDRPIASFLISDSVSSCAPFEVQFTNTSYYNTSQIWDLGGGSKSTIPNPVKYYINPGIYQVSLIAISPGGCRDTAYNSIQLYDTIGSKITYQPLNGCKPLSVDLTTFTKGPVTYTWDFGDGVLINNTVDTITHIYDFFGDFVPKVIMTDPSGCVFPITGLDTIRIIGAAAKFGLDNNFFCDSGMVNFIDSTTYNDSLTSYNWDFGDGTSSNLQNPGSHYYNSPGVYTVSLNVQTRNNCVDTFSLQNVIKIVESPLISVQGDTVICVNDLMEHLGVFHRTDTSVVQWQWDLANGNSSNLQNPVLQTYGAAGNFVITAIATNSSGCKDTALKNILVNPLPTITLPPTLIKQAGFPITIPATYTSNVITYNWVPAENLTCYDCPQPETNTKFNKKYSVAVIDSNGCRNIGQVDVIVVCPNTNVFLPNTFSPNGDGSNDIFYVRGKGLERVKSLRVFNRWGEVVYEQINFPVNDPMYGWDGKYKGNKPHPDVYVYQVEVFCENSEVVRFEGNVALIQ